MGLCILEKPGVYSSFQSEQNINLFVPVLVSVRKSVIAEQILDRIGGIVKCFRKNIVRTAEAVIKMGFGNQVVTQYVEQSFFETIKLQLRKTP